MQDLYISGHMYNSIHILRVHLPPLPHPQRLTTPVGGSILLLSDSFQTDFVNCLSRSFYPTSLSSSLVIRIGPGLVLDRALGLSYSSSSKSPSFRRS